MNINNHAQIIFIYECILNATSERKKKFNGQHQMYTIRTPHSTLRSTSPNSADAPTQTFVCPSPWLRSGLRWNDVQILLNSACNPALLCVVGTADRVEPTLTILRLEFPKERRFWRLSWRYFPARWNRSLSAERWLGRRKPGVVVLNTENEAFEKPP